MLAASEYNTLTEMKAQNVVIWKDKSVASQAWQQGRQVCFRVELGKVGTQRKALWAAA
jgi:hypothetical protein